MKKDQRLNIFHLVTNFFYNLFLQMKRLRTSYLYVFYLGIIACSSEDDAPVIDTAVYEGSIQTNPQSFPAGGGLDLDFNGIGGIAQLDTAMGFQYDLKILAYKTSDGGRPAIFLSGDESSSGAAEAVNVSDVSGIGLGASGFESFEIVTDEMIAALAPDGVFAFDPAVDVDDTGKPDIVKLESEYEKLVIGDLVVRLEEAEQPVFLVKSREGDLYKFQHITREGGGVAKVRWARLR